MSDILEDLKLGKSSSRKYVDNVETESDLKNLVSMSDENDSVKRDGVHKNDDVKLTEVDEESEELDNINRK